MVTANVFISGFVQGVGYRAFVKKHALSLGLTGWVKNLPDGRVEAMLQGDKKTIGGMIKLCKKGPFMAEVDTIDFVWEDPENLFRGFVIER